MLENVPSDLEPSEESEQHAHLWSLVKKTSLGSLIEYVYVQFRMFFVLYI